MARQRLPVLSGVRPTTAKVLESLLATLAPKSEGARVLELFAGTGQIGLGILGQGAAHATFIEGDAKAYRALKERIKSDSCADRCELLLARIPTVLKRLEGAFDIVVADPPYSFTGIDELLLELSILVNPGGLLVIEHHHKTRYELGLDWLLLRKKRFGETCLSFLERATY